MSRWEADEDKTVRELWGKIDAVDIGALINRTKNMVIGRARRLGLKSLRRSPAPKKPREPRPANARKQRMRFKPTYRSVVPQSLFAPESLKKSILEIDFNQCTYIEGNDHLCCGHETVLGSRWCAFHYRVVYRPPEDRKTFVVPLAAE